MVVQVVPYLFLMFYRLLFLIFWLFCTYCFGMASWLTILSIVSHAWLPLLMGSTHISVSVSHGSVFVVCCILNGWWLVFGFCLVWCLYCSGYGTNSTHVFCFRAGSCGFGYWKMHPYALCGLIISYFSFNLIAVATSGDLDPKMFRKLEAMPKQ